MLLLLQSGLPPINDGLLIGGPGGMMVRSRVRRNDGSVLVEFDAAGERAWPLWRRYGAARGDVSLLMVRVLF